MSTDKAPQKGYLKELGDSDFEIAEGQPDITGWDVKDADGEIIGQISDVLFDPDARKVRYLIVDLEDNELELEADHEVLVPIGMAELHESDDEVILSAVSPAQLTSLPVYDKASFSPETEVMIRGVFEAYSAPAAGTGTVIYDQHEFYTHRHFNDRGLFERKTRDEQQAFGEDEKDNLL